MIKNYKDLLVWQKSIIINKIIFDLVKNFPKDELFILTSQIRRSAISISSNIAEGHSRGSTKDYIKFLSIAIGSAAEFDTQIILAEEFGYLKKKETENIVLKIAEIQKMLHSIRTTLRKKLLNSKP